ncbi:FAD-dependent monooxygenase [Nocardia miyunensis]|uniref:FAD-dependent monooxygenase n=1 Tax=Nocardia miyunensis TaxID=282684 RepID=UPI00082DA03F|nr:FAD-dependent monooxygenase [Nocardia miyunensis]
MSTPESLPVAVVGAGIGGLSAAITLRRAGFPVREYEQAPRLRELGGGIGLRPRTVRILYGWGLGDEYSRYAARFDAVHGLDGRNGHPMGDITFPSETDDPADNWSDSIHRADLHNLLAAQIPAENIQLSRKCRTVVDHGDHVEIRFADDSSELASAVIGADGIHSVIRTLIRGRRDNAVYSGLQSYRGVLPMERVRDLLPQRLPCAWQILESMTMFIVMPLGKGSHVGFDALLPVARAGEESWRGTMARDALVEKLLNFDPAVPEIVRRMAETEVSAFSVYDREPITQWTSNRATLLGDAAHPFLPSEGQGANQAIQDAVVLAECLRGVEPAAIPAALRDYSDRRVPVTTEIHRMSRARHAGMMRG